MFQKRPILMSKEPYILTWDPWKRPLSLYPWHLDEIKGAIYFIGDLFMGDWKRPINVSKETCITCPQSPIFYHKCPERGLHICIHGTWMKLRARCVSQEIRSNVKRDLYSTKRALILPKEPWKRLLWYPWQLDEITAAMCVIRDPFIRQKRLMHMSKEPYTQLKEP